MIKSNDAIFSSLRLWLDANHNGVSEVTELHTLPSKNIMRLDLDFQLSGRVDEHGNSFRFRAKVRDEQGASVGRWAWDVFLVPDGSGNLSSLIQRRQDSLKSPGILSKNR